MLCLWAQMLFISGHVFYEEFCRLKQISALSRKMENANKLNEINMSMKNSFWLFCPLQKLKQWTIPQLTKILISTSLDKIPS
jgi:hypothetical protein